jgi:hypothetical protein
LPQLVSHVTSAYEDYDCYYSHCFEFMYDLMSLSYFAVTKLWMVLTAWCTLPWSRWNTLPSIEVPWLVVMNARYWHRCRGRTYFLRLHFPNMCFLSMSKSAHTVVIIRSIFSWSTSDSNWRFWVVRVFMFFEGFSHARINIVHKFRVDFH